MNTLSHLGLAVAVLGRKKTQRQVGAIVAGALIPDLLMFVFVAWDLLIGFSLQEIFNINYFTPRWQIPLNVTNSIPLLLALGLLAYWLGRKWLWLLALAALLHIAFDLPIHHDDAHAHFWPFSDWKFISPVSYWDKAHYGAWWSPVEILIVLASLWFGAKWLEVRWQKWAFVVLMLVCLAMQIRLFQLHWLG